MPSTAKTLEQLEAENRELRARLELAEEIVEAIRSGRVDALVVQGQEGDQVYTLSTADRPYRVMVEGMREGAMALREDRVVLYCNRQMAHMLRTSHEKLLGSSLVSYLTPAGRAEFEALLQHGAEGSSRGEVSFQADDGTTVPAYLAVSLLEVSEKALISVVATDLTEHKRHEHLLASEALSSSVFEQTSDAILVCDAHGQILRASQAAHRLSGENPLLRPFSIAFSLRYAEEELAAGRGPRRAGEHVSLPLENPRDSIHAAEVVLDRSDGRRCDLLLSVSPRLDSAAGEGFVVTMTDITARKRAELEMRRLHAELEQRVQDRTTELAAANRELEAFSYTVSHDLRAPLRHIAGFIEMLEEHAGACLDEESRRYVQVIAESAERMAHLLDDLLTLSRIGRSPLAEADVDLRQLVDEAIRELAPETEGRTIQWEIGPLPSVRGDRPLLRNVAVNYLSNAIKFTRKRDPARIEIGAREEGAETVVFVRDNGAGFDMRFVGKLFRVFQRLHPAEEFEGTGVGLASVARIIQRHGGRVWAEGAVDRGATFCFSLPGKRGRP